MREGVLGRLVTRVRPAGADAVALELAGPGGELWLDAAPGTAGAYLLTRAERRAMPVDEARGGRAHQALLHIRKRLGGARVLAIDRIPGERVLALGVGSAVLSLRPWGPSPALTLIVDGAPLASLGGGPAAWPPPPPAPELEWDSVEEARIEAAIGQASPARAVLAACPVLGPDLARALAERVVSWDELKKRLTEAAPVLVLPAPLESLSDADLARPGAVRLLPTALPGLQGALLRPASWREAAATFLAARRRGERFRIRRGAVLDEARRAGRRLRALGDHLAADLAGLRDPDELRRQAEALLSAASPVVGTSNEVDVPDPYDPDRRLRIGIDPRISIPANVGRLFDKARRLEGARRQVEARRSDTRERLGACLAREARALAACDLADLDAAAGPKGARVEDAALRGPRHYLTTRGLSVLVGRGARENHRLTFAVAGPEDFWLHARDVPGAHVILRDPEGRAGAEDVRQAAELALFFSEARAQPQADVHVTRRKHVRAARGGRGRVRIAHSDTLRVAPRDPDGRLRRRL